MKELMCKKRHLLIDNELKKCDECYKKQLSGFVDKTMCQDFNLMYYENTETGVRMIEASFKCCICGKYTDVYKKTIEEDFPSSVKCCQCGSLETYRVWSMLLTSVAEGELGNSKNNYEKNMVYHPASLTGHIKGKTIKTIK